MIDACDLIERWEPQRHLPVLEEWVRLRGMGDGAGDTSLLPPTGFVAAGIAAGFLYRTDSKLAYVGSFVSDPRSSKRERGDALDALIAALRCEAAFHGYTALAGTPSVPSLADRFARLGWALVPGCSYAIGRV